MRKIIVLLTTILALSSFSATANENDQAALKSRYKEFTQAMLSREPGKSKTLAGFYTAQGKIFADTATIVKGKQAIEEYYSGTTQITQLAINPEEIIVKGDTAYIYGYYTVAGETDGKSWGPGAGKYMDIWLKDDRGQWYLDVDFYKNN